MFAKEVMKQSLPLLIICGLGGVITGNFLGIMSNLCKEIPGLLVVIPAVSRGENSIPLHITGYLRQPGAVIQPGGPEVPRHP